MAAKKPDKKKPKKAKAKRKVVEANARSQGPSDAEIELWRRETLEAAERILQPELRPDMTPATLTRMTRNCTAALALLSNDGQKVVAVEEMAELSQLLCRDVNGKPAPRESIQEEIADVYIILAQMARLYFDGKDEFNATVNRKMTKQEIKIAAAKAHLLP